MNFMVDLETLGTAVDSAFIEVGVVAFIGSGEIATYSADVYPEGSYSWETVRWWMEQTYNGTPPPGSAQPLSVERVLLEITDFMGKHGPVETVWSNGATFDIPILERAYRLRHFKLPWSYKQPRDTRTLEDVCFQLGLSVPRPSPEHKHSALSDAKAQALWVRSMCGALERLRR
jgi:hypothetical protein